MAALGPSSQLLAPSVNSPPLARRSLPLLSALSTLKEIRTTFNQRCFCSLHSLKSRVSSGSRSKVCSRAGSSSLRESNNSDWSFCGAEDGRDPPDGLIFEDGIFEDAFNLKEACSLTEIPEDPQVGKHRGGLIPEEWKSVQLELSKTKTEKKKELLAKELKNAEMKELKIRLKREKIGDSLSKGIDDKTDNNSTAEILSGILSSSTSDHNVSDVSKASRQGVDNLKQADPNFDDAPATLRERAVPRNPRLELGEATLEDVVEKLREMTIAEQEQGPVTDPELESLLTAEEKALLKKEPDFNKVSSEKWMLLHTLATSGQIYLLDELLKQKIDIHAVDKDGLTALQKAVLCKKEVAVGQLLGAGADIDVRDKHGASLLHYAVQTGSTSMLKYLIKRGIDLNPVDENGWTPLHLAVQGGRGDIVKLLLIKGAENLKTKDGLTPLDVCLAFGRGFNARAVAKVLKKFSKVKVSPTPS